MPGGMRITITPSFERWQSGLSDLGKSVTQSVTAAWTTETEQFYDRTQDMVHVLSGQLKASGQVRIHSRRHEVVGQVTYGAPYAIYEHARGGSHAFIQRAWQASSQQFETALGDAWEATVRSWS